MFTRTNMLSSFVITVLFIGPSDLKALWSNLVLMQKLLAAAG